ncbi:hypothetical protein [Dysosmobacter sp. HCP28S3_G4]
MPTRSDYIRGLRRTKVLWGNQAENEYNNRFDQLAVAESQKYK